MTDLLRSTAFVLALVSGIMVAGGAAAQDRSQPSATASRNALGQLRADRIVGREVVNAMGESVGTIEEIVVSTEDVVYAVVSVGGLFGFGERKVAIPFSKLRTGADQDTVLMMSEASADELKALPRYQAERYRPVPGDRPVLGR